MVGGRMSVKLCYPTLYQKPIHQAKGTNGIGIVNWTPHPARQSFPSSLQDINYFGKCEEGKKALQYLGYLGFFSSNIEATPKKIKMESILLRMIHQPQICILDPRVLKMLLIHPSAYF